MHKANDTTFVPEPLTIPGQNTALSILHEVGQGVQFDTTPLQAQACHFITGLDRTLLYRIL